MKRQIRNFYFTKKNIKNHKLNCLHNQNNNKEDLLMEQVIQLRKVKINQIANQLCIKLPFLINQI